MKKTTIVVIVLGVLLLAVAGLVLKNTVLKPLSAGLQVKSVPVSTVFLDGKKLGRTLYEDKKLASGDFTLRLVPENTTSNLSPWERKIKLINGAETIINWSFGESESKSSGEVMTLEKISDSKTAALQIISSPDSSLVKFDGEPKGFTPLFFDKQEPSDKGITLSASGFEEKTIDIKLLPGYKLILNVKLAEVDSSEEDSGSTETENLAPTPSAQTTPSAKQTPTPTPKATVTPKPTGKVTPTPVSLDKPYVTISSTPTGFLRVRSQPSTSASEIAQVKPGESYPLLDEQSGWYKIPYQEGKEGWISGQYAKKFE
ncbi:MAG: SH3 domain-containing protein [bacterium]|nr:SH3 domain-containing protein [bacterium]